MWTELLLVCVALFCLLYWYVTRHYDHFTKLGIPQADGKFPFGSIMGEVMAQKRSAFDLLREQYQR